MLSIAGDLASVLGFPLALVGIMITIKEARRAKKAAEGAKEAANEALARIKSRILAEQFIAALRSADEMDLAFSGKEWEKAFQRCRDTREMLARIGQNKSLLAGEIEVVLRMIDWLGEVQQNARNFADKPDRKTPFPRSNLKQIDEIRVELITIVGRLENTTWEV